jgi:hypothetical protein
MKAVIEVRHEYGITRAYPVNREAKLLAKLAGTKTLTVEALAIAYELGYQIEQQTPASELAFINFPKEAA